MALGFATDPVTRWCWPEPDLYFSAMQRFVVACAGKAFEHDSAYVADDFRGAALWLPPDVHADEKQIGRVVQATVPESKQSDLGDTLDQLIRYVPSEPHWYLPMIAVDPAWQSKGLGSALLKQSTARCDRDGLRAYLESSNPRNVGLYERHGFVPLAEVQAGDVPPFTPMIRDPR